VLPGRFERKFYIVPSLSGFAYGFLKHTCKSDTEYPSEQINSIYFDTLDLEQYERSESGDYQKDKIRIRWYGEDEDIKEVQTIFVELKSRRGFAGYKQRLKLLDPGNTLTQEKLKKGVIPYHLLQSTLAQFGFFPARQLLPVIKISYWRYRYTDISTGQRISLDCRIRSYSLLPGLGNEQAEIELPGSVLEIKSNTMDTPLSLQKIKILEIDWTRFSKYAACINSHIDKPGSVGHCSPSGRIIGYKS